MNIKETSISIRISTQEKQTFIEGAEKLDMSMSQLIRTAVKKYLLENLPKE